MSGPNNNQAPEQAVATTTTGTTEPAAEPAWFSFAQEPVFGGANALQILLLFLIGSIWAASIWLIVDRIKDGLGLQKPHPKRTRAILTFAPLVASVLGCLAAFPAALSLAGVPYSMDPPWIILGASAGCGLVSWAVASKAHDWWGTILTEGTEAIINRIRGLGGEKVPGYTTKGVDTITPEQVEADRKAKGLDE